ncbi:MAG: hypothetical protein ACQES4_07760, partial [Bacillota bacterium]
MAKILGKIALMGSGELSGTMVETHKRLLAGNKFSGKALFLDTPAGFQENVDLLARRAVKYFEDQVLQSMGVASFKSAETATAAEAEKVNRQLSEANYVLIGPGSPTYAVHQLKNTPVPTLLSAMVTKGGCLVSASAAALTTGSHTLPVYEIYKVGQPLYWEEGLNILGHLGLDMVVIPHWNNAEGGNHDTRYCYMGERRFLALEQQLPPETTILGIDEHTACILDFSARKIAVEGIGQITIRCGGFEQRYGRGEELTFEQLLCVDKFKQPVGPATGELPPTQAELKQEEKIPFWDRLHEIENTFQRALEENDTATMTTQLLETDRFLWQAQLDLENPEFISQGRELYREMIVLAGTGFERSSREVPEKFEKIIKEIASWR